MHLHCLLNVYCSCTCKNSCHLRFRIGRTQETLLAVLRRLWRAASGVSHPPWRKLTETLHQVYSTWICVHDEREPDATLWLTRRNAKGSAAMRFHARREPEETARPRCRRSMSLSLSLSVRWISLSRFDERSCLGIPLARPRRLHPWWRRDERRRKPLFAIGVADSLCPPRFVTRSHREREGEAQLSVRWSILIWDGGTERRLTYCRARPIISPPPPFLPAVSELIIKY